MVLHGDLQRALLTITDAPYTIKPHHSGRGHVVWQTKPEAKPLAHCATRDTADLLLFGLVAIYAG